MKGYCAVLLLMCMKLGVLAHSATQVRDMHLGGCLFGSQVLSVGSHTFHPCMEMICDMEGQVTFVSCPRYNCDHLPGHDIVSWIYEDETKDYPYCCAQPVCRKKASTREELWKVGPNGDAIHRPPLALPTHERIPLLDR